MNLEKEFKKAQEKKARSYGKLVSMQKRLLDEWALSRYAERGYPDFKMAYMPFLMNIPESGATNKDLAALAGVTKQAMSKVIGELEELGLVKSHYHEEDARMSIIRLTRKGMEMIVAAVDEMCKKTAEYERVVGKERLAVAMEVMWAITDYELARKKEKKSNK